MAKFSLNSTEKNSVALGGVDASLTAAIGILASHFTTFTAEEAIVLACALVVVVKLLRKGFSTIGSWIHS